VQKTQQLQHEIVRAYDRFQFHQIYQKLHHFCVIEMGSFYLDILKDRMYTMTKDSPGRRSAQTAMHHILEALVRWLAPILSFTAEEIWQNMPGERGESVFLQTWYELDQKIGANKNKSADMDLAYWDQVIAIRETVSKELEKLRAAGDIGSSLDAEVDIYCAEEFYQHLQKLGDELRFLLITSYARIHPESERPKDSAATEMDGVYVVVKSSSHDKCVRCWHHREDVGRDKKHPELCSRCVENVAGCGEARGFV